MEALAKLKFWKSNNSKVGDGAEILADSIISDQFTDDEDDDSFFELELTLPKFDQKFPKKSDERKERENNEPKIASKPQSPVSILRQAPPKLRVFVLGKLSKKINRKEREIPDDFETESLKSSSSSSVDLLTVKFQIEDGSIVPRFSRSNSSSLSVSPRRSADEKCEASRRFSKEVVTKYLSFINPMKVKPPRRENLSPASPARTSATVQSPKREKVDKQSSGSRFKVKYLGKSRSSPAMVGVPSPAVSFPARGDHPHDGIEGAILHCKLSLNSSTGKSALSRCSSDPSYDKSIQVSEDV